MIHHRAETLKSMMHTRGLIGILFDLQGPIVAESEEFIDHFSSKKLHLVLLQRKFAQNFGHIIHDKSLLGLQIQCLLYQVLKIFNIDLSNGRSLKIRGLEDAVAEVLKLPYVNLRLIDGSEHASDVLEPLRFISRKPLYLLIDRLCVLGSCLH